MIMATLFNRKSNLISIINYNVCAKVRNVLLKLQKLLTFVKKKKPYVLLILNRYFDVIQNC